MDLLTCHLLVQRMDTFVLPAQGNKPPRERAWQLGNVFASSSMCNRQCVLCQLGKSLCLSRITQVKGIESRVKTTSGKLRSRKERLTKLMCLLACAQELLPTPSVSWERSSRGRHSPLAEVTHL